MEVAVVIGLVFALAVLIFGTIVTLRVVRAVKRGVERTGAQVRRTADQTVLKARSVQPGPIGEAARIRLELRNCIDSTRAELEAGARNDPSLTEAVGLLDKLHEHARHLDGELRLLMEREPEHSRVASRLPEARERMRHIKESAGSLRYAAQDRARQFDAEGLSTLRDRIDIESGALRHWTPGPANDPAGCASAVDGSTAGSSPGAASGSDSSPAKDSSPATEMPSAAGQSAERSARPELRPSGQGLDPSLTDPTADRPDSVPPFGKRRPRNAS